MKLLQQIECCDTNRAMLNVWIEAGRVHVGDQVTFKETGGKRWDVTEVYDTRIEGVNRGWGLDLPKSQRTER